MPLPALENHIFSSFRPYTALISPCSGQSGLKVRFLVKLPNLE